MRRSPPRGTTRAGRHRVGRAGRAGRDDPGQACAIPVRQDRDRLLPGGRGHRRVSGVDHCRLGRHAVTHGGHPTTRAPPPRTGGPVASRCVRVSTRGDYASRALLSLALHGAETPTSVRDIAERTGLPQPYLEQILLALKGAGLVRSKRGVGGGYVLARPPAEISPGPDRLGGRRSDRRRRLRGAPRQRSLRPRGPVRPAGRLGRRRRDHPHPPAVLQPGRHGRPGPGQRRRTGLSTAARNRGRTRPVAPPRSPHAAPMVPGLDGRAVDIPTEHRDRPRSEQKEAPGHRR